MNGSQDGGGQASKPADDTTPGQAAHDASATVRQTGAPAANAGATEAELGRNHEAGLNTDSRGGIGSAARRGGETEPASAPASTQPSDGTRIGEHSSQGLAGAQGSGGGAERGVNQPPPRRKG